MKYLQFDKHLFLQLHYLTKENIRKLEFKTNNDRAEALTLVLSFESINDEFEFFVNRKDIAQVILTKNDNEQVGPFFLEYITGSSKYNQI